MDLLREYVRNQSETAFAGLVHRHINLVYSVAMRFTGNEPDAQDVTQAVFIILARKAASLRDKTNLAGWLYETTRFTAMSSLRNSARRRIRENEAHMQSDLNEPREDNAWQQFAPHLEEAMAGLGEKDRALLALRYFSNKSGTETAALLGIKEWAVHKRTSRALEKLRKFFSRRGLVLTTATIATAISVNSVQAAPALLAKSVSAVAITKGAAVSGSTLSLIKGALKIMAWSKVKVAVVTTVTVLILGAGTTAVVMVASRPHLTSDQYTQQGWQLWKDRKLPEAAAAFKNAIEVNPRNAEAWTGHGWAVLNNGNTVDAENDFKKALSLNPRHPAALNGLGQIYLSQKKYDEAETYLTRLAGKSVPSACSDLAKAYLLQDKFDEAETWAQMAVDSGHADDLAKEILAAATSKRISDDLRAKIEPQ